MDTDHQKQLLPHYLAVFVLTLATLAVVRTLFSADWAALLAVLFVVLSYPTLVRLLGVEPDAWRGDG